MINEDNMKILVLSDGSKWLTINQINYEGKTYKYLIALTDDEEDIIEEFKVVYEYIKDGKKHMKIIKDQELLKTIIPQLIPETQEYFNNPEKIKELIEEKI